MRNAGRKNGQQKPNMLNILSWARARASASLWRFDSAIFFSIDSTQLCSAFCVFESMTKVAKERYNNIYTDNLHKNQVQNNKITDKRYNLEVFNWTNILKTNRIIITVWSRCCCCCYCWWWWWWWRKKRRWNKKKKYVNLKSLKLHRHNLETGYAVANALCSLSSDQRNQTNEKKKRKKNWPHLFDTPHAKCIYWLVTTKMADIHTYETRLFLDSVPLFGRNRIEVFVFDMN